MNDMRKELSILIVHWNTVQLLRQCIDSIFATAENLDIEILVIDNASDADIVNEIETEIDGVNFIFCSENLGFPNAVNIGLKQATGKYLLFAHPDILFTPSSIQSMLSFLDKNPQAGIVGGNLYYPDGSFNRCSIKGRSVKRKIVEFAFSFKRFFKKMPMIYENLISRNNAYYWDHQDTTESYEIWNACMMARRDVYEAIGGFCEDFFVWFADVDWCYMARKNNWKTYYLKDAKVIHYELQSRDYLDNEETNYKVDAFLVYTRLRKDMYTLLKRQRKFALLLISIVLDKVLLGIVHTRRFFAQ